MMMGVIWCSVNKQDYDALFDAAIEWRQHGFLVTDLEGLARRLDGSLIIIDRVISG